MFFFQRNRKVNSDRTAGAIAQIAKALRVLLFLRFRARANSRVHLRVSTQTRIRRVFEFAVACAREQGGAIFPLAITYPVKRGEG